MVIETSQLYFIYLFIYLFIFIFSCSSFRSFFTKIVFKGTATINREKHMLKTRNQGNTKIENYFSIEF